jgi:hypothetical protein
MDRIAKIRHKFLEIRIEEYFKNGNKAPLKKIGSSPNSLIKYFVKA